MNLIYYCPYKHPVKRSKTFGMYYCPTCDESFSSRAVIVQDEPAPPQPKATQLAMFEDSQSRQRSTRRSKAACGEGA